MPRVVGGSQGGGRFLMGEVPLYPRTTLKEPLYLFLVLGSSSHLMNSVGF